MDQAKSTFNRIGSFLFQFVSRTKTKTLVLLALSLVFISKNMVSFFETPSIPPPTEEYHATPEQEAYVKNKTWSMIFACFAGLLVYIVLRKINESQSEQEPMTDKDRAEMEKTESNERKSKSKRE